MRTIAPLSVRGDGAPDSWFVFGNGQAEGERKTLNVTQIPLGGCIHSLYDNTACYPEHQRLGGYDMTPSVPSSYRRVTRISPALNPKQYSCPSFPKRKVTPTSPSSLFSSARCPTLRREQAKSRHLMRAMDGIDDDRKILQAWHILINFAYVLFGLQVSKSCSRIQPTPINDKVTAVFERTA